MLAEVGVEVVGLDKLAADLDEPVEDGDSFEANAILKARYYSNATGQICLADDSGLAVDALEGAPGVHSARYAGVSGVREIADAANNQKLIEALRDIQDRTAHFVCVMALCRGNEVLATTRGEVEGQIIEDPRGENGFGYDPHFYVPEFECTTAQMEPEQKNAISHRGIAVRMMLERLRGMM